MTLGPECERPAVASSPAVVVENEMVGPGCYRMLLANHHIACYTLPGQFVHVRLPGPSLDPLLRRPFSVCQTQPDDGTFTLLYRVVGRATAVLAALPCGAKLDVLGPLGRGFDIPEIPPRPLQSVAGQPPNCGAGVGSLPALALVAGGLGVAPLIMLSQALSRAGLEFTFVVGARTREFLVGLDMIPAVHAESTPSAPPSGPQSEADRGGLERRPQELAAYPVACRAVLRVVTEDGSAGEPGLATRVFGEVLASHNVALAYACGPAEMLREVARIGKAHGVPIQMSLEERMACGLGACLGCAVKASQASVEAGRPAYLRVCYDGPVFDSREVDLDGAT